MEVVEDRSRVFQAHRPAVAGILSAQRDIVSLVVDRLCEFGNIVGAGASAKQRTKGPAPDVMILPVVCRKRPTRRRSIAQIKSRDAVIKIKVYRLRRVVQPLDQR